MRLAQRVVRCDQTVLAHQPVDQRLHRERAAADRATEFEALGGKLIELAPGDWKEVAQAA